MMIYKEWDPINVIESGKILSLCSSKNMYKNGELLPSSIFVNVVKEGAHEALVDNWFYTRDLHSLIPHVDLDNEISGDCGMNSQRKYNPQIGSVFPDLEKESINRKSTDLIVVTTLVEKTTNIAGLCRSAEVFGAKTLVIPSKTVLRDPTFVSMSVTAEQWIDLVEVTPANLPGYIKNLQKNGYTAVCLEQTHDSVEISEYKFPPKTVLILGNEKSGVAVEYLPLMDVCVEIPQRGVIRSLNVHVSGAIAMWQYNRSI